LPITSGNRKYEKKVQVKLSVHLKPGRVICPKQEKEKTMKVKLEEIHIVPNGLCPD